MSSLKCLIVDDEANARNLVAEYAQQFNFIEVVAQAKNAFEATNWLANETIDLMFLDIQMPGMLGTDFLAGLTTKPLVIFTTAYESFAVESYDFQAVDYLLKPFSIERFSKAIQKAYELHKTKSVKTFDQEEPFIFINVEYSLVRININEIQYIEGLKDYIKIYLKGKTRPVLTKSTLKGIEEKLPSDRFLRVHKSFIVNTRMVESLKAQRIKIGEAEIPVSDVNLNELLAALKIK